jgi:hypothetical protein
MHLQSFIEIGVAELRAGLPWFDSLQGHSIHLFTQSAFWSRTEGTPGKLSCQSSECCSRIGQAVWDLWCTKWHCGEISPSASASSADYH